MADIKNIMKDDNIVKVLVAQAKSERLDSEVLANAERLINDLVTEMNPHNRWLISQLIGYTVNDLLKPQTNFLDQMADVKRVGFGDKALFKVKMDNIRAFVQAKGSTTPRSKIAHKTLSLDTVDVSARPVINTVELLAGRVSMADLIREATDEMAAKTLEVVRSTLETGFAAMSTPYYGSGQGIITTTLNPMIRHWMRYGGAAVVGDIEVVSKLAEKTGFAASTTQTQFADGIINEQNTNGFVGRYIGAEVAQMVNPYKTGSDTDTVLSIDKLFILPTGASVDARPLKVLFEGDVQSQEATNIDDKAYEVRLDQFVGAGLVYGDHPTMSVYEDLSL